MPPWMIKSTEWWSQPLAAVWWFTGVVSVCIGSITWYCVQQFSFGGDIPPLSILSVAYRYEVPPSKRDLKYPIVLPVGKYPGPVGGFQALIVFLGLKCFLCWDSPREVVVEVVRLVVHKNSACPEFCMGYCPSDLGYDIYLRRYHLVNLFHVPVSGLWRLPGRSTWVFNLGPLSYILVIPK